MFGLVTSERLRRFFWLAALPLTLASAVRGEGSRRTEGQLRARLLEVSIPFVANSGQIDPAVAYYAPTLTGTVYVTREGRIVYSLPGERLRGVRSPDKKKPGWSLTETPVGGRAHPNGSDPASTGVSYFLGSDPVRWRSGLRTFQVVSLGEIWPGIALELKAHGKNVEKLFLVESGADPSRIRMSLAGARSLRINKAGAMVIGTGVGGVIFTPPVAYQVRRGVRHSLSVAYELHGKEYGFRLGDYDSTLPVLIDPLLQATFLGGSNFDLVRALAIHPISGEVYVTGETSSTNFPGTTGGAQAAFGGIDDAFVALFNASLTKLNQATYLGGSGDDLSFALAIRPTSGEVYVAGVTLSTDFPSTTGGAQAAFGGTEDGFVARMNASLTSLTQATYLGSTGQDEARALAIQPTPGEVYVAGFTLSSSFPGTAGGAQSANGGGADAFVARLSPALTTINQATYLGGTGTDGTSGFLSVALAIHPASGEVYVAGPTDSTNFPGTAGGAQSAKSGGADAFVARLNASLTALNQATYLGGSDADEARALGIHPISGEVYVAGETRSMNFPGTSGGAQTTFGGVEDAFVARFNALLTTLNQSTYLGGNGFDDTIAIAIHPTSGEVYAAGETSSTSFPGSAGGAQAVNGGGFDAFIARFSATLTELKQSTYLGGSGDDIALALDVHTTSGDVYVAGDTGSTNFPGTAGGAQAVNGGGTEAFVARLSADLAAPPPTSTPTNTPTSTPTGPPPPSPAVPTLSFHMLALLAFALAGTGSLVSLRGRP